MVNRKVARKSRSKKMGGSAEADAVVPAVPPAEFTGEGGIVETTGRFIVVFKKEASANKAMVLSTLNQEAGLREVASSSDYEGGAIDAKDLAESEVVHFDNLGMAKKVAGAPSEP